MARHRLGEPHSAWPPRGCGAVSNSLINIGGGYYVEHPAAWMGCPTVGKRYNFFRDFPRSHRVVKLRGLLVDAVFRDPSTMDMPVEKAMSPKLPTIGVGQQLSRAVEMLEHSPALLVLSGGRPVAVLSRTDVLSYLEAAANG